MTIIEWGAICTIASIIGGLLWNLATRISKTEGKAEAASKRADTAAEKVEANAIKVEKVASELASHRETVAKEYVSYTHMVSLENRLVDAITQLGNRIDSLFSRSPQHA